MDQTQILKLLFARLGLPLPTIRWWTYWQIASLLDDIDTAETTWVDLLNRLSVAQLESEAVELLTPLLLVKRRIGKSAAEVRAAIGRPSVLSDYFVSLIYKDTVAVPAWLCAHSGHVPIGFTVADEDRARWSNRVKIGVLPVLERLGKRIAVVLVEQFEYEMVMLSTRCHPQQGQLDYFAAGYRHNKITGPLDQQEDHLWRSAYLRAVAYAVSQMDMPPDLAVSCCEQIMPLSKFLGGMRPPGSIPTWLPRLEFKITSPDKSVDDFLSMLVKSIADETNDSEILGVLDAHVVSTSRLEVDILAVLVLADSKEPIDVEKFFSELPVFVSPAKDLAEEFVLVNPDGRSPQDQTLRAFTGKLLLGLDGYLQAEILMRPPWVPILNPEERVVCRTGQRSGLRFSIGETKVGHCLYWNYEWSPVHDTRVGPSACTATLFSKKHIQQLSFFRDAAPKLMWSATVLTRDDDYLDFSEKKLYGWLPLLV